MKHYQKDRTLINNILIIVFFTLFLFWELFYQNNRYNELIKNKRFTIGVTNGTRIIHYGKNVLYYYTVNGKTYKGAREIKNRVIAKEGRYYVMFSSKDPSISRLLFNFAVPENLKKAPKMGWKKMPEYIETFIE